MYALLIINKQPYIKENNTLNKINRHHVLHMKRPKNTQRTIGTTKNNMHRHTHDKKNVSIMAQKGTRERHGLKFVSIKMSNVGKTLTTKHF